MLLARGDFYPLCLELTGDELGHLKHGNGLLYAAGAARISQRGPSAACASSPDTQLIDSAREGNLADVRDTFDAGARVNTPARTSTSSRSFTNATFIVRPD